ncbi:MAG: hypothetical protein E7637_07590 [Ruminococcaceae bacterium]|nr:hypothetical protein [Oscillospiraceae bacterium]
MKSPRRRSHRFPIRLVAVLLLFSLLSSCSYSEGPRETTANENPSSPTNTKPTKRVAITFDDGPQCRDGAIYGSNTKMVVDELNKYGFHATFFVVGKNIVNDAGNLKDNGTLSYVVQNGNEIGIHGFSHINYRDCSDAQYAEEINRTRDAIHLALPGYNIRVMRPPEGEMTATRVAQSPYAVIYWDVDSEDSRRENQYAKGDTEEIWTQKVNTIVNNVMSNVKDGDIILLHDLLQSSYDATVIILQRLKEEGYDVVTVSELLGDSLQAGRWYAK